MAGTRAILVDDDQGSLNVVRFVINVVFLGRHGSHLMHGLFLLLLPALRHKALSELPETGWEALPRDIEHQDHDEEGENEGHGAGDHLVNLHSVLGVFAAWEGHGSQLRRAVGLPLPAVSESGGRAGGGSILQGSGYEGAPKETES